MLQKSLLPLLLVTAISLLSLGGAAKTLPHKATAITADEVRLIYTGKSAHFDGASVYFSPDMTVKAIVRRAGKHVALAGFWSVSANEVCMKIQASDGSGPQADCWKWWWFGTDTFTLWSVRSDGRRPDEKADYFDQSASLKHGDSVSEEYELLGGPPKHVCIQC